MSNSTYQTNRGFTIVELLIVIVVIAILAAISIVAYNGIQQRANNTAAATTAENMAKKIEAYNSVQSAYPVYDTITNVTTALNNANNVEANLSGSGLTIGTPTAANGKGTVRVQLCTAAGSPVAGTTASIGFRVFRWDYSTNAIQTTPDQIGGTTSGGTVTCTTIS